MSTLSLCYYCRVGILLQVYYILFYRAHCVFLIAQIAQIYWSKKSKKIRGTAEHNMVT
jgi:hypothetical protein